MKDLIIFFCLCLCLFSCEQNVRNQTDCAKIQLPLGQKENRINLSEIADSIQYIPLETKDGCLIGNIDKILQTDENEYLIVDKEISASIFLFDKTGTFLHKIGNRGGAKGEYVTIEDVAYYKGNVYVWDSAGKKVLKYSKDNVFMSSFNFDYTAYSMAIINDNRFAFCCDYTPNHKLSKKDKYPSLIIYDIKNTEVSSYLYFDSTLSPYAYQSTLNNLYNNNLYLPLNDTIYKVTDAGLERKYALCYKDNYLKKKNAYSEKSKTENITTSDAIKSFNEDSFPHLITYFECDKLDILFMRMGDYLYYGFYYPASGKYRECSARKTNPVVNDIDDVAQFSPRYSKENILYSIIDPIRLLQSKMNEDSLCKRKVQLHEDSNPVIVRIFMK